ncbi:MAG TPA: hypothetical protein VMT61_09735 [Candidatus Binataceae bacterium]|nr:hypothetical protein [Candidatus Binataceae bacterium]
MDATILEGFAGDLAPINIFVPVDFRRFNVIKAAKIRNSTSKRYWTLTMEKFNELPVHLAAMGDRGKKHTH